MVGSKRQGYVSVDEISYSDTYWDDLRVDVSRIKLRGVKDPDFVQFKDNGSGSTGIFAYRFDKTTEEEVFFNVQLPHSYKLGTDICPHVHWSPINTDTTNVVWGLEYSFVDINGTFGNSTIITVTDAADGTAFKHQLAGFADITGSSISGVSAMFVCRLFRDATNLADTYDNDVCLLEFDFHFQIDAPGSRQETVK